MSLRNSLVHAFYKAALYTILRPVRNVVYKQVGKTKISQTEEEYGR